MIGSELVRRLALRPDLQIRAVYRDSPQPILSRSIHWVRGDLVSASFCDELVAGVDLIYHLAHPTVPLSSSSDWPIATTTAIQASLNLIAAIERSDDRKKLIFVSSGGSVYNSIPEEGGFREESRLCPTSAYGIEKLSIEHYIRLAAERGTIRSLVLRVANAYGRLLPADRKQGFVGTALTQALQGIPIRIFGSLNNVRDYVHVDDVCEALIRCFDYDSVHETFNVGTGVGTSVGEVIKIIELAVDRPLSITEFPLPTGSALPMWSILNADKAKKLLRWKPKIELHKGISSMAKKGGHQ